MDYADFLKKIDDFIRKYYLNKIIRGMIWLCAIFLAVFLLVITAEYYSYFNPLTKTILFYLFLISQLTLAWFLVGKYLLKYLKLGAFINHEQASIIIGNHFPDVKDKLLNTLQLQKVLSTNPEHEALILASINQRVQQLQPIPFVSAIKISENKKYLRYAIVPAMVMLVLAFTTPAIITDGTTRIIKHNQRFIKKAPFGFEILNKNLSGVQGEDFQLQIKLSGTEIPQEVYIEDGFNSFKLTQKDIIHFNHTFKNLQEDVSFRFKAGEFYSDTYTLKISKKPSITDIKLSLTYPAYLKKQNEVLENPGDMSLPEGTVVKWLIGAENTTTLNFLYLKNNIRLTPQKENQFSYQLKLTKSALYSLKPQNNWVIQDALNYHIEVLPDAFPQIEATEKPDSLNSQVLYFIGKASDDYGLNSLSFHYKITASNDKSRLGKQFKAPIKLQKGSLESSFFYFWPISNTGIKAGEEISYYFEVADNDGINGPKTSRTSLKTYRLLSKTELIEKVEEGTQNVKQKISDAIKQAQKIQDEAKKLNQDLLNSKGIDYQQQKQAQELLDKQQRLEELLKEISKENQKNLLERNQLDNNKELLEKQKQIQNLFDNVLDEKTKSLLKEIQKMLEKQLNEIPNQELKQLQSDEKSLKKELDRILELYKQLEVEQKINQAIDQLEELAKKQNENVNKPDLNQQKDIKKDFNTLKENLKEIAEKNQLLEQPENFDQQKEQQQAIEKKLQEAEEQLTQNRKQKANEAQKEAASEMQEMANKLKEMQNEEETEENQVDAQALRQILQNLLKTSFDQEKLMLDIKNTNINDPRFNEIGQKQRNIKDNLKLVEDSLYSLSKRVPQISATVNKEVTQINQQIADALQNLTERKIAEVNRNQQYALTAINNLSLMLSEALQQLQNAMKNAKSGGKGKPKPGMSQLSKMQQELNKNMQKAKEQMQQQGIPQGQKGNKQMSQQFSEMAQQQQMIRQALQELNQQLNKDGKGKLGNLEKIMKDMEQTETDLVNKRITQEAINRQQDIQTRLLEAEKAEREREQDTQKESKAGKQFAPNYNLVLKEYEKIKENEAEMLKTVSPALNNFYKSKISDYFKKLNKRK
ncbi:DUF4175 family protein [Pedobacter glucosidilyticus]|uniref:DUF4175 family protein n=1 Tax=Pedobacter glucosidilyticus TaxID=1122941 RepID=UPI0004075702|nr:DUF4175 family protein [Pedobacter glucosidilyticus]